MTTSTGRTALERHLEKYLKDLMQQKFRMQTSKDSYEELYSEIRERIVDQTTMISRSEDPEAKKVLEQRRAADQETLENIEEIIKQKEEIMEKITQDVYYHMIELSGIEINRAGFVTHIITVDDETEYNESSKVVRFSNKGHAEVPIATTLKRWTDASQVRLIPVESN